MSCGAARGGKLRIDSRALRDISRRSRQLARQVPAFLVPAFLSCSTMAAAMLLRNYPLLRRRAKPSAALGRSCSCHLQHRPLSSTATGSSTSTWEQQYVGRRRALIDTNVNNKSTEERGYAANKYGDKKNKDYNEIIRTKSLDYTYKSITFGTFGAFGSGTWDVIERACDPRTHPDATGDYDPWRWPAPKRDFILSLGFALQRANVRMLRGSSLRRRRNRAKDCFASGSRSQ
eukprot:COSAG06_NODE_2079_length_7643_cov_20.586957_8_plen_232_part_00